MLKGIYRYYIDYNDDIWPKTTRIVSFGPLVSVFLKLTTIIQRFSNVPKRRDPVLFYYTQPPTRPPQHGHVTTPSHQQQAAGDDEGSRHTSSSISSLWKKAQTMRDASFGPLVSFFLIILHYFLILTSIVLRFSNVPNQRLHHCLGPRARDASASRAPVLCITHSHHDNTTTSSPHNATTTTPKTHTGAEWL